MAISLKDVPVMDIKNYGAVFGLKDSPENCMGFPTTLIKPVNVRCALGSCQATLVASPDFRFCPKTVKN
jgi:hypothetical protein